jgi:hypothetical protein
MRDQNERYRNNCHKIQGLFSILSPSSVKMNKESGLYGIKIKSLFLLDNAERCRILLQK